MSVPLQFRRGLKSFTGTVEGGRVVFRCRCDVYPAAEVTVEMSVGQAEALLERKPVREVLAGYPREVIELFSSGMTPAEFDQFYGQRARPLRDYALYGRNWSPYPVTDEDEDGPAKIEDDSTESFL